jgi:hypothetical protein
MISFDVPQSSLSQRKLVANSVSHRANVGYWHLTEQPEWRLHVRTSNSTRLALVGEITPAKWMLGTFRAAGAGKSSLQVKPLSSAKRQKSECRGVGSAFRQGYSVATDFPLTRVSPASCQCRAPRLELAQALAPLTEPVRAGTLRCPEGVAEVSMVPPRPELAQALALACWTELVKVP